MLTARSPFKCWQSSEFSHRLNCGEQYAFILPKFELNINSLLGKFISLGNGKLKGGKLCDEIWCASLPLFENVYHILSLGRKTVKGQAGFTSKDKKIRKIIKHACISTEHDYIFLKKGTTLKDLSDNESLHSRTVRDVHIFTQPRSYLTNLLGNSWLIPSFFFEKQEIKGKDRENTSLWASCAHKSFPKV